MKKLLLRGLSGMALMLLLLSAAGCAMDSLTGPDQQPETQSESPPEIKFEPS